MFRRNSSKSVAVNIIPMSGIKKSLLSLFDYHGKNADVSKANNNASINPYMNTFNEQIAILGDTSIKIQQRMKACDKIAACVYLGGMIIEPSIKKDSRMIDIAIDILMKESEDIQLKIVIS